MTQLSGDWAAMYVSSINRYDHLCMSILRAAADGGSLTDVLEIVGDSMNACDHVDDESAQLFIRAVARSKGGMGSTAQEVPGE